MKRAHPLRNALAFSLTLCLLLTGCSGESLMGTEAESAATAAEASLDANQAQKPGAIDVSGAWNWSREEKLTLPDWVVEEILQPTNPDLNPEGPVTQVTCTGSGTMTLVQTGAAFSGTFTQTAHACVTKRGQGFQDPLAFVPVAIEDGRIRGRSIRLLLNDIVVDCSYHAVISDVEGGVAVALNGGGECIIPGHPKSEVPGFEPPPGGTSKTLHWTAVRS